MTVNELIKELEDWKKFVSGDTKILVKIGDTEIMPLKFVDYNKNDELILAPKMKKETYGEFEFSTDDFFESVLPRHHEPISERDSYNADF